MLGQFNHYRLLPVRRPLVAHPRNLGGGLGIPGGIAAGVLAVVLVARRRGLPVPDLLDVVAPALPVAQAIGRLGNWFNQELYGRPTELPWALRIDLPHRPDGLADVAT
jgi:prolipoprotein diacylglyceryltransferase